MTSNDLTENLGKIAGTANLAGVSFEELIGLMTSSITKGASASKTANALKSVFVKLQQMSTDGSMPKLSKQFDEFGISITDQNGAIKDAYSLLEELSVAYKEVYASADVDKQNKMRTLVEDIGGIYNSSVLNNILTGFSTAVEATNTALESSGSAQKEFDKSLDQIAKKADATKGAFLELVWGDGGLKTFLTTILDVSTNILRFLADTKALNVVLIEMGIILAINVWPNLVKMASSILMMAKTAIPNAISAWSAYSAGVVSANTAMSASIPVIGLIMVGITALTMAWNGYNTAQEKKRQASVENANAIKQESESIKSAIDLINNEKTSREQIVSAVNNVNSAYGDELKAIKNVNDLRQKAIDLLDKEAIKKAKQYTSENLSGYKGALEDKKRLGETPISPLKTKEARFTKPADAEGSFQSVLPDDLKFNIKTTTDEQIKQLERVSSTIQNTSGYVNKYGEYLGYVEAKLVSLRKQQSDTETSISTFNEKLAIQGKIWDETSNSAVDMTDEQIKEYNAQQALNSATEEATEANEANVTAVQEQIDAHQALMDSTSDVLSSMEMLNDASQEQAENGELSAETAMKLIESGYAGALAYDAETNSVMLDREAMALLVQAKLENQIANLELANSGLADILINEGNAAVVSATGYNILALAKMDAMNAGASGAGNQFINNQKQIEVLNSKLDDLKTKGTGAFGAVGKSAGGASKSVQTLEDKVKSATNYMKSMIDKEIKALREAKEAEEERVEAEIDALKERREAQEAYWDAKIEKVKKANEILEEQNKLQQLEQNLALAKSKKVKVFTGEGFEYKEDVDAVSKASQELSDYKREQQIAKEVETLEKLKKKALANIDKQIKGWEKYKKEMQKNFDAQIKALENYKDQLDDLTNGYKEQQDKLIAEQLLGAKLEQGNWQLRIDNLKKFVKEYNGELSGIKTDVDTKGTEKSKDGSKAGMPSNIPKHASGSYAVPTDEIAIVGDSPNRELSIGSKLNMGGVMARLKGGTGVMPNTLTERLVNMAYNTNTSPISNSNSSIININVDKVELPSVTNGKTFVNELLGLKTLAIQTSS